LRKTLAALLVAVAGLVAAPAPHAYAGDISDNPECQRLFQQTAQPYYDQMLANANAYLLYPIGPDGRPPIYSWPSSAYGPLNGYGPGSPYGPAFGLWGFGSFGPGFGGPGGYGIGPNSVGGPAWQFAQTQAATGAASLNAFPGGLTEPAVASQLANAPGGLGALAPGDLIALAGTRQGLVGNVFGGSGLAQVIQANRIAEASLRQAVFANRIAAASFNADRTSYPLGRANDLFQVIAGIQAWVSSTCPRAIPEDAGGTSGDR